MRTFDLLTIAQKISESDPHWAQTQVHNQLRHYVSRRYLTPVRGATGLRGALQFDELAAAKALLMLEAADSIGMRGETLSRLSDALDFHASDIAITTGESIEHSLATIVADLEKHPKRIWCVEIFVAKRDPSGGGRQTSVRYLINGQIREHEKWSERERSRFTLYATNIVAPLISSLRALGE